MKYTEDKPEILVLKFPQAKQTDLDKFSFKVDDWMIIQNNVIDSTYEQNSKTGEIRPVREEYKKYFDL